MPVLRALGKRQTIGVVALIAIPLVVALLASGWFLAAGILYNPDTQTYCIDNNLYGGGGYPDVPTDGNKIGELFDDSGYWLSWANDGTSETIGIQGKLYSKCPGNLLSAWDPPTKYRYSFSIKTATSGSFGLIKQDDIPNGFIEFDWDNSIQVLPMQGSNLLARTIHIDGRTYQDTADATQAITDGSILRVDLILGYTPFLKSCCEWKTVASDESQLKSAVPEVSWEKEIYQTGDTARVHWVIPVTAVDGAPAYYLTITNMNDGSTVGGWSQRSLSTLTGVAEVAVTSSMFVPGGINRIRAEIYSQIFRAAIQDTVTIDDVNKAPVITSVKFNQAEFREGEQAVVTITAVPNALTNSPIVKYYLLAHIGGEKVYDGFSTSSEISFIASRTGILTAEASAIDEAGRSSAVKRVQATVGNVIVDCEVYPELPQCGGGGGANTSMVILGVVLLVAGMALFLFSGQLPLPQTYKLLLLIVGVILAIIGGAILILALIAWAKSIFPFAIAWGGRI